MTRRRNPMLRPDVALLKSLLVRLMTRNESDATKRMLDRHALENNLSTLSTHPASHLGGVMQIIARAQESGQPPSFEGGLMLGACLALCSSSRTGRTMLARMLDDIVLQQEDRAEEKADAIADAEAQKDRDMNPQEADVKEISL